MVNVLSTKGLPVFNQKAICYSYIRIGSIPCCIHTKELLRIIDVCISFIGYK
jgi:hypothetical protein